MGGSVLIQFNGEPVRARAGESVAAETLVSKGFLPRESGSPQGRSRFLPVAIVEPATTPVAVAT